MRAAENARWIVRATNNGITAAADPAGRITQRLPEFVETAGRIGYSYNKELTFYTRFGDWFAWLCVATFVILLVSQLITRLRTARKAHE